MNYTYLVRQAFVVSAVIIMTLTFALAANAQGSNMDEVTLEDLLNIKTSVATKKTTSTRETPGIVSVITEDEIKNMGARDLIDVLRLVPSIHFATDVQGVVGLGIRGLWAAEGKHLLMFDGIEMNELQYAGTQFGGEFPVDQIKRIEIIRGPGSAIYGGFAELAVINVITKSGSDLNGMRTNVTLGQWENVTARTNLSASVGRAKDDTEYSLSAFAGTAKRGDGKYTGNGFASADGNYYSGTFDFEDADDLESMMVNIGYKKSDFKFRFLYNKYNIYNYTMFGYTAFGDDKGADNIFESYNVLASYDYHANEKLTVTPQIQINQQTPWKQTSPEAIFTFLKNDVTTVRLHSGLSASYDVTEKINLLSGIEYISDTHTRNRSGSWDSLVWIEPDTFTNGTDEFSLNSTAVYLQGLYKSAVADVTLGARYENPNKTKDSFVPRLGVTHAESNWHTKFLYAQAFRSPVVYNFENKAGANMLPETSETVEVEFGYALSKASYLTANIYSTKIDDPIVYSIAGGETYANYNEVGTDGLELEYKWRPYWGQLQLGYAMYKATDSDIAEYKVPGHDDQYLGLPTQTASANATVYLGSKDFKLNTHVLHMGEKYAYDYNGTAQFLEKQAPITLVSLYLNRDNVLVKGLTAGFGLHNVLDEYNVYAQPYSSGNADDGHSPMPGPSRELMVRLDYSKMF